MRNGRRLRGAFRHLSRPFARYGAASGSWDFRQILHILLKNQFSHGMRMVWDRKEHKFHELALDGKPIEEKQLYSIAVSKYHFMNLQEFLNISLEEAKENGELARAKRLKSTLDRFK